jgi:thiol:disulfide interchange protein DsbD
LFKRFPSSGIYTCVRFILNLLFPGCLCLASLSAHAAHTQARLLLAAQTARPGETILAGVHLHMDPRWHTYWKNSGGSGQPTKIEWQLPAGVTAGEIQWPVPDKLPAEDLTTYIYEKDVVLLVPLKLASALPPGQLDLKAKVSWLECEVLCVPGGATVETTLVVGTESKPSKDAALIAEWQKKLPQNGDTLAAHARWEKAPVGDSRPFLLEWNSAAATEADFFPYASEQFEVQPITERLPADAGKIRLRVQVKKLEGDWPKQISGLLIQKSGPDRLAYEVNLSVGTSREVAASNPASSTLAPPLWQVLLYAFIGGLILNVMPCVLPVIALKILGFVSEAKNEPARIRKLGLIYTAGVLSSFLVLALIVIALQTAGHEAGWGFQFGNPYFLIVMTVLVTLIALNLFGVFEVTLVSAALSSATDLASKHGSAGAFFNGLLTTVLATSCSAPFLAAAVGFSAGLKSPLVTLLVLLTVGAGVAAPYLALSWQPAWLKILPRPGLWMQRFKVAMGFPMAAAGVWLCSIVAVHYGDRAWWLVMFLVFVGLAAWVYGEFVQRGNKRRVLAALCSAALLAAGYAYALEYELRWREPIKETSGGSQSPTVAPRGLAWQTWSPQAVAEARAAGRPVVVDFTAKWCPTCNGIVKPAFESAAVQKKLQELNAVPLVADYTRFPPAITAELKSFGRAAVPLVLVYPTKTNEPPMVFDVVTSGTLLGALDRAVQ